MSMERCVGLSLGPEAWGPSQQLQGNPNAALRHFFWQVSMRMARGSVYLLSSHGRGIRPQDALKTDS